ncbi:hypothetical protein ABTL95_19495, partial [Acinetobacter baumannii]
GFRAFFKRLAMGVGGTFSKWTDQHLLGLDKLVDLISFESKVRLSQFRAYKTANRLSRLVLFKKLGIYRQTVLGTLILKVAAFWGKL